jgi:hypothetical protein
MATWHDLLSVREEWFDAPESDTLLNDLLEVAQQSVIAYAPTLVEPVDPGAVVVIPSRSRTCGTRDAWTQPGESVTVSLYSVLTLSTG